MKRKYYLLAVVALLSIPVVTVLGGMLAFAINPETAAGHANYVRNFWLLNQLKLLLLIGTGLLDCILWLLCCGFLIKAKARSYRWLALAVFGPFGLAGLVMLADRSPGAAKPFRRSVGWRKLSVGVVYEAVLFVAFSAVAYQAMELWRDFKVWCEAVVTGVPIDRIVEQQNASGGMYAFGEEIEVLFLVALLYLLRPVCAHLARRLGAALAASRRE